MLTNIEFYKKNTKFIVFSMLTWNYLVAKDLIRQITEVAIAMSSSIVEHEPPYAKIIYIMSGS